MCTKANKQIRALPLDFRVEGLCLAQVICGLGRSRTHSSQPQLHIRKMGPHLFHSYCKVMQRGGQESGINAVTSSVRWIIWDFGLIQPQDAQVAACYCHFKMSQQVP